MSRIGKAPLIVPSGVTLVTEGDTAMVKGPKGELRVAVPEGITLAQVDGLWFLTRTKANSAMHGFIRSELANAVQGVARGWVRTLELSGVGYRAAINGMNLTISVGFSHPVTVAPPPGITFAVSEGKIMVNGVDKQLVGQVAANIRAIKKPEPYKGKGIRYEGEHIRKKAGKAAKAVGGAPGAK